MGGSQKYVKNHDDSKYQEMGTIREHFVRQTENKLMFFTGRKDSLKFSTLNLAEGYTLREARLITSALKPNCEIITLTSLQKELK